MKRAFKLILLLWTAVAAVLCGCGHGDVEAGLDAAELIMEERPDSALTVLDGLSYSEMSDGERARYALLLTQAYDKNYIDVADDSLISEAWNYYAPREDKYHKMMAAYYYADAYYNDHDYENAMTFALETEYLAKELSNHLYLARVYLLISSLYASTFNNEKALEYTLYDIENSKLAGKNDWVALSTGVLAERYLFLGNYKRALELIDSAQTIGGLENGEAMQLSILAYAGMNNHAAIDSIYQKMRSDSVEPGCTQYAYIANARFFLGDKKGYDKYIAMAESIANDPQDTIEIAGVKRDVAYVEKRYNEAFAAQDILTDYNSRYFIDATTSPLHLIQIEFEKRRNERLTATRKIDNIRFRYTTVILCMGICMLAMMLCYILQTHRRRLSEQEARYNSFVNEYDEYKRSMQAKEQQLESNLGDAVRREVMSRFSWIEAVSDIYCDSSVTNETQKNAYKRLKETLETVRKPKFQKNLEKQINMSRSDIIARLRRDCPTIIDAEIRLIVFACAGLSTRTLATILDKNENAVYSQKHRVRKKLEVEYPEIASELSEIFK